ncbi:MAG: hypothetical protein J5509_01395 [Lachnospiraceae bacterium]|nr:hypothetical protein [Lachnospiraceae bacterium]
MSKRARQYIGLFVAIISYYIIHEGAHLAYALITGVYKQVNIIGLGVQIDVFAEKMTDNQMGMFCLVGSLATIITGYILVGVINILIKSPSDIFKACMYYVTIIMMFMDPLYLCVLCSIFGGGDMNGISLIISEIAARVIYGILFIVNAVIFIKVVLPKYKMAFQ